MFEKLQELQERCQEIDSLLSSEQVYSDRTRYQQLTSERARIEPVVDSYQRYREVERQIADSTLLLEGEHDPELRALAREDIAALTAERDQLAHALQVMLLPRDPRDEKSVILEIRAGTGGEEAALFAFELFRMYARYAEAQGWKVEVLTQHMTGMKGVKELIALISGRGAYSRLRFESGVHRVQRVPETETQGRIHTSAVTVAVLPEAEDVDVEIQPADLKIDVYRSSGPGGQSVNTTDSAVRITHIPTGLVVSNQDEKSQHKNKAKALKILKARLLDLAVQKQQSDISRERKTMVGSGDRSERIRTYNFPQGRVTDHRINLTLYRIESIMLGDLQEVIDALVTNFQAEALKASGAATDPS